MVRTCSTCKLEKRFLSLHANCKDCRIIARGRKKARRMKQKEISHDDNVRSVHAV
jgi:hypothetical protein